MKSLLLREKFLGSYIMLWSLSPTHLWDVHMMQRSSKHIILWVKQMLALIFDVENGCIGNYEVTFHRCACSHLPCWLTGFQCSVQPFARLLLPPLWYKKQNFLYDKNSLCLHPLSCLALSLPRMSLMVSSCKNRSVRALASKIFLQTKSPLQALNKNCEPKTWLRYIAVHELHNRLCHILKILRINKFRAVFVLVSIIPILWQPNT